jgi:hypothetical protein
MRISDPLTLRSVRKIRGIAIRGVEPLSRRLSDLTLSIFSNETLVFQAKRIQALNATIILPERQILDDFYLLDIFLHSPSYESLKVSFRVIDVLALNELGKSLDSLIFNEPTVLFQLQSGNWIGTVADLSHLYEESITEPRNLPVSRILESFKVFNKLFESKSKSRYEIEKFRKRISDNLIPSIEQRQMKRRILELRDSVNQRKLEIHQLTEKVKNLETSIFHRRNSYQARQRSLLNSIGPNRFVRQEDQEKSFLDLDELRREKMKNLYDLFPIDVRSSTIYGMKFEKSDYDMRDEDVNASALSLVIICLQIISDILDKPLKNEVIFGGSRSYLVDVVADLELPLFYKGVERPEYCRALELLQDSITELLLFFRRTKTRSDDILKDLQTLMIG